MCLVTSTINTNYNNASHLLDVDNAASRGSVIRRLMCEKNTLSEIQGSMYDKAKRVGVQSTVCVNLKPVNSEPKLFIFFTRRLFPQKLKL